MLLVTARERELIGRVAPVLLHRFEDLALEWRAAWMSNGPEEPPVDLPEITRVVLAGGIDAGMDVLRSASERLVADGVSLERIVEAVLLWEETILRRMARDAVEDIFTGAAALNRMVHLLVLFSAEGYSLALRSERDEVRRGIQDADQLKSDVLSMISHDLKTPLTTIQACAVELQSSERIEEAQRRRFLEMISQNAERLANLITRMLDVSKIEARALDLSLQPIDLPDVIHRLVDGILPTTPVRLDLPASLPEVVADRDALERILVNLIDNGVRFSPPGEPVSVEASRARLGEVELRVADRGPGIPDERREGLFSKFYQVDLSPAGRRSGSGLGLAIVRGLAEAMGGSVGYRPNEPTGSVFWVRLREAEGLERTG